MKSVIVLTSHAVNRARERGISKAFLTQAIRFPDKVDQSGSNPNRFLIKKLYFNKQQNSDHLLMIIGEQNGNTLTVITIIDTSKITKYY